MKREILEVKKAKADSCCPGHDVFPSDTYNSRLSKKAHSRDTKKEHRYVRRIKKHLLNIRKRKPNEG